MELIQLKYFVKLAEELSFTEAAKKLFITQSALSLSIKKLEEECTTPLFDRIGKYTYLTEAGTTFADFAQRAIKEVEAGMKCIQEKNGIYTGKLQVGVVYSLRDILNECVLEFTQKYPEAGLSIVETNSVRELADLVLKGKIDFALTYKSKMMSPLLECSMLFETPLCVIAQKDHPVTANIRISLKRLKKYPFVFFPQGIHTRMEIEQMFIKKNLPVLTPRIEVNDASLILQLVSSGRWLTILSEGVVESWGNLKAIPITGAAEKLKGCLIRPKEKFMPILEHEFYRIVKEHWGKTV